jgi:hypothetical protein
MRRVMVVGSSGAGKTTFARNDGAADDLLAKPGTA